MEYNIRLLEINDFCCKDIKNIEVFYFERYVKKLNLVPTPKVVDVLYNDIFIEFKRVIPNEKKGKYYSSIKELEENLEKIAKAQLEEWNINKKIIESRKIALEYLKKEIKKEFILFCYAEEDSFTHWLKRSFKNINKLALLKKTERIDILSIYDKFYTLISQNCLFENGNCDKLRALILIKDSNEK